MKNILRRLGHYKTLDYGMTPYPDERMFEGIRGFQKAKGLAVDGVVEPRWSDGAGARRRPAPDDPPPDKAGQ